MPWYGVDFDGTLTEEGTGWEDPRPVLKMVARVKAWLAEGKDVRIFTARVCNGDLHNQRAVVTAWCIKHLGQPLTVTNEKDWDIMEIWDDKAIGIIHNTGDIKNAQVS